MPNQQNADVNAPVQLTALELTKIISEAVEAAKKPYLDPIIEQRKIKARETMRLQREESLADEAATQNACPHVRDDNTSTIAWINNYHRSLKEYHREGFCQRCGKPFKPGDINYAHFASIPTGRGGIVN